MNMGATVACRPLPQDPASAASVPVTWRLLAKQLRRHFVQVEPPVHPLVPARRLHRLDPDALLLQALDDRQTIGASDVGFSPAPPEQLQFLVVAGNLPCFVGIEPVPILLGGPAGAHDGEVAERAEV